MISKLDVVTDALLQIKRFGVCHIGNIHADAIEIVKDVILDCDDNYRLNRDEVKTSIYLKNSQKK
ncbi:hypothetical protein PQE70_gp047 [Bacillus phage vB_BanS_Nate]|uniref:Uncharacterized protein n=1 Tax=Bacillus phage vB_BanS_Nate TaxID=2894788 RepID=A0AAE8YUB1_9CAUD|nr:hypothetical protein PQE70_gp047 [Bacillus phage vB_BanS_Nate]UGO50900.1 hypothetical protein NATE_47 [Bacillus phage vB_BanS_Nate]